MTPHSTLNMLLYVVFFPYYRNNMCSVMIFSLISICYVKLIVILTNIVSLLKNCFSQLCFVIGLQNMITISISPMCDCMLHEWLLEFNSALWQLSDLKPSLSLFWTYASICELLS